MTGTRIKTKRAVTVNKRHKSGTVDLRKGAGGMVDEIIGDTAVVRFDGVIDLIAIHVSNVETEDHPEGPHE